MSRTVRPAKPPALAAVRAEHATLADQAYAQVKQMIFGFALMPGERFSETDAGYHSAECGRLIRQAWVTGVQVTSTTPGG